MYLLVNKEKIKNELTNEDYNFTKIIKENNNIYCYKDSTMICAFKGIVNMDIYYIEGGEFTEKKSKEEDVILLKEKVKNMDSIINTMLLENLGGTM